jgi:hypothetical protein
MKSRIRFLKNFALEKAIINVKEMKAHPKYIHTFTIIIVWINNFVNILLNK